MKYKLDLPLDAAPGSILRVKLGGRDFSILLPDYLNRGETIVVIAPAGPAPISTSYIPATTAPAPREIRALEFRDGDVPSKYPYVIPTEAINGQVYSVTLSGRDFNIRIPDYVRQGETVIVIAPAALI